MNIDEIQSGKEMDALVAEKVMGWDGIWDDGKNFMAYPPWEQKMGVGYSERYPIPDYSTNVNAVWEVVEKMLSLGWHYTINYLDDYRYTKVRHCCFSRPKPEFENELITDQGQKVRYHGHADTAPLAIC